MNVTCFVAVLSRINLLVPGSCEFYEDSQISWHKTPTIISTTAKSHAMTAPHEQHFLLACQERIRLWRCRSTLRPRGGRSDWLVSEWMLSSRWVRAEDPAGFNLAWTSAESSSLSLSEDERTIGSTTKLSMKNYLCMNQISVMWGWSHSYHTTHLSVGSESFCNHNDVCEQLLNQTQHLQTL